MTIQDLIDKGIFKIINVNDETGAEITEPFCCDLLSVAMSKAPAGCAWVTVMANMNTLAVASLTGAACVILAEKAEMDEMATAKARQQEITVFSTDLPVFKAALQVHELLTE